MYGIYKSEIMLKRTSHIRYFFQKTCFAWVNFTKAYIKTKKPYFHKLQTTTWSVLYYSFKKKYFNQLMYN